MERERAPNGGWFRLGGTAYGALMANIVARTGRTGLTTYKVEWTRGGRGGVKESWTIPEGDLAVRVRALIDAHHNNITADEVKRLVLGDTPAPEPVGPTIQDYTTRWLDGRRDYSKGTRACNLGRLRKHVWPHVGRRPIHDLITSDTLVRDLLSRAAQTLSPWTLRGLFWLLRGVCKSAAKEFGVPFPLDEIDEYHLPKVKKHKGCYLTYEQARHLAACGGIISTLIEVAFGTGMRIGELIALNVGDVRLFDAIPAIYVTDSKTDSGVRAVEISRRLADVLRPVVVGRPKSAPLFVNARGERWKDVALRRYHWNQAVARANRCEVHPPETRGKYAESTCDCPGRLGEHPAIHDTRRSHIDWLLDDGWHIERVSLRVGHARVTTTLEVYSNRKRTPSMAELDRFDERWAA